MEKISKLKRTTVLVGVCSPPLHHVDLVPVPLIANPYIKWPSSCAEGRNHAALGRSGEFGNYHERLRDIREDYIVFDFLRSM